MLTYTFSRREKALILGFAIFLVLIAWFWFVFQNTINQIDAIDGQIAAVESETDIATARIAQMNNMTKVIEQRKAEGAKATVMPTYDNLQPLMAELNKIMSAADTFTLTFDDLNRENADYIMRGVRVDYTTDTYKKAEKIVESLYGGKYPCAVDTVAINDPTVFGKTTSSSGIGWSTNTTSANKVSASVHVTFFEKYPEGEGPVQNSKSSAKKSAGITTDATTSATVSNTTKK